MLVPMTRRSPLLFIPAPTTAAALFTSPVAALRVSLSARKNALLRIVAGSRCPDRVARVRTPSAAMHMRAQILFLFMTTC